MQKDYERFFDADQNRIAWADVIRRFEERARQLDEYAPMTAERLRKRFYEEAAQPLVLAARGEDLIEDLEAELSFAWPLTAEEAGRIAFETGRSAQEVADEHRRWALAQT